MSDGPDDEREGVRVTEEEALLRERDEAVSEGMSPSFWLMGAIRRVLYPLLGRTRTWGGLSRGDRMRMCP